MSTQRCALVRLSPNVPSERCSSDIPRFDIGSTGTPRTVTIVGENPAIIHVGDTYADLGVVAKDSEGHDLSNRTFLNGVLAGDIMIDTSGEAADTIDYVATDTWRNTATSTRTVIVQSASSSLLWQSATHLN